MEKGIPSSRSKKLTEVQGYSRRTVSSDKVTYPGTREQEAKARVSEGRPHSGLVRSPKTETRRDRQWLKQREGEAKRAKIGYISRSQILRKLTQENRG